jgi:hypothetical protein
LYQGRLYRHPEDQKHAYSASYCRSNR